MRKTILLTAAISNNQKTGTVHSKIEVVPVFLIVHKLDDYNSIR